MTEILRKLSDATVVRI